METRNLIIIGGGPAGLTAALYAARGNLKPLVLEGEPVANNDLPGGQLMTTTAVENYPGFPAGTQGPELMTAMREQAVKFGAEVVAKRATKVDVSARPFRVWVGETEYAAHSLILATGAKARMLELDRIWDLLGHGVSTCATCDGFFFRDQEVVVVGGGDAALEEATFLTRFAKTVTVVHRRDSLRASKAMQDRAFASPKLKVRWNSEVVELVGDKKLTGVKVRDTKTGEEAELTATGLFMGIGHDPDSKLVAGQLDTDAAGYVKTTDTCTSVPGVFAAGDVQDARYRQAITSAGSGCMAALNAQAWLDEHTPIS